MPKVIKKIDLLLTLKHWVITDNIDLQSGVMFSDNFKFGDFISFFCKELMAGKCTTGLKRMCSAAFSANYNYCSLYSYFRCRQGFHNVPNKLSSENAFSPSILSGLSK